MAAAVEDNLTGGQIQDVLDYLNFEALRPVVWASRVFDVQVVHLLANITRNRKRKLSALPREDAITMLANALILDDPQEQLSLLEIAKIERGFICNFLVNFLNATSEYARHYQTWVTAKRKIERNIADQKMAVIERHCGCKRADLYWVVPTCRDYLDLAFEFRNQIVNQYIRHSFNHAQSFAKMKGENFHVKDVHQNLLTACIRAIDKYDASKGALTSYINFWLLNAQTSQNPEFGHEYGIAYTIPQLKRQQLAQEGSDGTDVNYSISLDKLVGGEDGTADLQDFIVGAESVQDKLIAEEEHHRMLALIKSADIRGLGRLYLDIDEVFSNKERKIMKRTMKEQGIV